MTKIGAIQRVANNTAWNLLGQVLPMLVGMATIPVLIRQLGLDRFGFLTLVWMLIGYAGVFDFGISRAMTRVVAQRLNDGNVDAARHVSSVGLTYMLLFGCAVGTLLAITASGIVEHWLGLPDGLNEEGFRAFLILCTSVPVVMLTSGYAGCLQAWQHFGVLNRIRIALGFATYLGPLLIVLVTPRLEAVVGLVVFIRILANAAHAYACSQYCGLRFRPAMPDRASSRELFSLGGWIAVSNFVSPLMTYLDRLIIGGLLPVRMIAYYATPYDILGKLMIFPYALMNALFPAAAGLGSDTVRARVMYFGTLRVMFVLMFPPIFLVVTLAGPGLTLWLGSSFADHATVAMQVLAVGILFNVLAQVPATMIQAFGQPRWMAIMHLCELPLFLVTLWFFTSRFGIVGTACAATLRFTLDALAVFALAQFRLFGLRTSIVPALLTLLLSLGALFAAAQVGSGLKSLLVDVLCIFVFFTLAWRFIFTVNERNWVLGLLRPWSGRHKLNQGEAP